MKNGIAFAEIYKIMKDNIKKQTLNLDNVCMINNKSFHTLLLFNEPSRPGYKPKYLLYFSIRDNSHTIKFEINIEFPFDLPTFDQFKEKIREAFALFDSNIHISEMSPVNPTVDYSNNQKELGFSYWAKNLKE